MRTTVTLDNDTRLLVERLMKERGITFKEAVNEGLRRGLGRGERRNFTKVHDLGQPKIDLTHALRVAAALEDEVRIAKLREGR